jgi:hypothetical protein
MDNFTKIAVGCFYVHNEERGEDEYDLFDTVSFVDNNKMIFVTGDEEKEPLVEITYEELKIIMAIFEAKRASSGKSVFLTATKN